MYDEILRQKSWKFVYVRQGSSFICAMEVRLHVPWKFIYMCHGSSLLCDMEPRSLHGSCCMGVCVVKDV